MSRALVFGKFMPLHKGHELVIRRAFDYSSDVTIVLYDGKYDERMPTGKRLDWLEHLYPQAKAIVSVRDPIFDGTGDDPKYAEVYADGLEFLGQFDYVFSSEPKYDRFADLLGAEHVLVDPTRSQIPCSGTNIRNDLFKWRTWLDSYVYSSLIQKVVFVGTESTGKSTLAEAMAKRHNTEWVHEYGRELWGEQNWSGSFSDMLKIGREQITREVEASHVSRDYLFCDTNAWTTLQWSLMAYKTYDYRLWDLVYQTYRDYTWILCDNDFGWIQDGTRELDGHKSIDFQEQHIQSLEDWEIPYQSVSGSLEDRMEQVDNIILKRKVRA